MALSYSSAQLRKIGSCLGRSVLSHGSWDILKHHSIRACDSRGIRGGINKRRTIVVILNRRGPCSPALQGRGANVNNIVRVPIDRWKLPILLNANVRSVSNKVEDLTEVLKQNHVDIACLTETWLETERPNEVIDISGYNIVRNDRSNRQGGGVAALIRDTIPHFTWPQLIDPCFESLWITMRPNKMPRIFSHVTVGVIYHPPRANNWEMTQHICKCVDSILQKHPSTGLIITGDMNQLKDQHIKSSYSLKQTVTKPTRGNNILDKVLTNMASLYGTPLILPQIGKSDHFAVLCQPSPDYDKIGVEPETRIVRTSGHNEKALFASALMNIRWEPMYAMTNCSDQFNFFLQNITDLLDDFLPLKSVTYRKSDKPWITQRYKDLIAKRQRALFDGNFEDYKALRNKVNRMSRSLRSTYYSSKVSGLSADGSKKWWNSINELMGRKQSNNAMVNLANQHTDGNVKELADKINKTFQSVSADLPKLQATHQHPASVLPDKYSVSVDQVEKKLIKINPKKSVGPDQVPNWVFIDFAGFLAGPIACIFNSSFREGYIPEIWKSADVVPLPKVNPPKKLDKDLRPISLTPVLSKVQESFVHSWMWEIIQPLLDKLQFGAVKGTCTTHALILMLHDWLKATDNSRKKNFIQIVLLDYAKAFDHINPNILMQKLTNMDIPDPLLRWVECFLMNRRQRVKIGTTTSEWLEIWGTVPQGTLIGVLCFICMINDLQTDCTTVKYVDDTSIYHATNNPEDHSLQVAVNTALQWSKSNDMRINPAKSKEMIVSFAKEKPTVPNIIIDGMNIERVQTCTLLGITLNEDLTWHDHIEKVYKKASQRLFFVAQLRKSRMSGNELVTVYISLVRPILEYGCQLWHGGLTVHQGTLLESIQERALAIAFPQLSYTNALSQANLPTLHQRRDDLCKRMFHDAQDPCHKLNALLPPERIITHNQRNAYKYPLPKCHTNRFKDSFINYCLFSNF